MAGNIPPSSSAHNPAENNQHIEAEPSTLGAIIQALLPILHIWPEYLAGTLPDPQRTRAESGYPPDRPHQPTAQLPSRSACTLSALQQRANVVDDCPISERHDHLDRLKLEKERIDVEKKLSESSKERPEQIEHLRNQARLTSIEYHDSLKRNQEILQSDAQIDPLKTQLKAALLARDSQTDSIASLKQPLNVRKEGVGYFANFSPKPPTDSSQLPATPTTTRNPALGFDAAQPDLSTHHLDNPALDDEAQLNFEYLRNTLLQFLEHKETRGHPLPLSPQMPSFGKGS
ncbi:hypothetical protein PtA15_3A437 [Puccinia triticina]|uniref:GRIP domain-containing protein n=1 Tax=Puccinia triticina TaxID=208348 RepID=A0ABY7CE75_9BASI|nr:uncharacterized protein PtA15_3A437 [Puccinia triticina]WAQ83070.1 hypothetical protein PtA15_3A437 [Puccinia triticina]